MEILLQANAKPAILPVYYVLHLVQTNAKVVLQEITYMNQLVQQHVLNSKVILPMLILTQQHI